MLGALHTNIHEHMNIYIKKENAQCRGDESWGNTLWDETTLFKTQRKKKETRFGVPEEGRNRRNVAVTF